jgi:hypothetical protein
MKVTNNVFPLASSANRIALLTGILSGTVGDREVEAAVLKDTEKRKRKKPVVAEGIYFDSVTDAARYMVNKSHARLKKDDYFDLVQSNLKRISRMCSQDCWEGYYWAE